MNSYADHAKRSMGKFPKGDNMLMDNMRAFEILGLEPQNGKLTTEQIARVMRIRFKSSSGPKPMTAVNNRRKCVGLRSQTSASFSIGKSSI